MPVLLIIGGLFAVYLITQSQQQQLIATLNANRVQAQGPIVQTGFPNTGLIPGNGTNQGLAMAALGTSAGLQVGQGVAQSAAQAGSAVGSAVSQAIPFIGSLVAPIFSLLAAHSARVKGATDENSGLNNIIPAITADIQGINAAYNAGQINDSQAIAALQTVYQNYWNYMTQFRGKPGVAGGASNCQPSNASNSGTKCDKTCTAGCCHGCNYTKSNVEACIRAIQNGGGTVTLQGEGNQTGTSKFGGGIFASYSLTWRPSAAQTSALGSLF